MYEIHSSTEENALHAAGIWFDLVDIPVNRGGSQTALGYMADLLVPCSGNHRSSGDEVLVRPLSQLDQCDGSGQHPLTG